MFFHSKSKEKNLKHHPAVLLLLFLVQLESTLSQERASKHLLELWDSAKLQDAGANLAYLPSLHPHRDGSGSEEQNQSPATKQSIWRGPRATEKK